MSISYSQKCPFWFDGINRHWSLCALNFYCYSHFIEILSTSVKRKRPNSHFNNELKFEMIDTYWHFSVPPESSTILSETGYEVNDVIGPLDVNSTLVLTCDVKGGTSIIKGTKKIAILRHFSSKANALWKRPILETLYLENFEIRSFM